MSSKVDLRRGPKVGDAASLYVLHDKHIINQSQTYRSGGTSPHHRAGQRRRCIFSNYACKSMALVGGCRSWTPACSPASSSSSSTARPSACWASSPLPVRVYAVHCQDTKTTNTSAYTGLHVDVDRIRAENEAKTEVERKGGLIIWSGRAWCRLYVVLSTRLSILAANPTKAMKDKWRQEAQAKCAPHLKKKKKCSTTFSFVYYYTTIVMVYVVVHLLITYTCTAILFTTCVCVSVVVCLIVTLHHY